MNLKIVLLLLAPLSVSAAPVVAPPATAMETHLNPQSGLYSWKIEDHGFSVELIQLLPDVVRAMYQARGIPDELTESLVSYCVFGTVAINTSTQKVSYRVADWRYVTADGRRHTLKTKTEWVEAWHKMGVPYGWSILPDDQDFEVGDWSQGFTTVALAPNEAFDLEYTWSINGEGHQATFKGIRCAPKKSPLE